MNEKNREHFFICPYCGKEISMMLDLSEINQRYIEDCEICCNPIEIIYDTDGEAITLFDANKTD